MTTIPVPNGTIPGWLSIPEENSPWPGVVVVHDALGMSRDLQAQARWLADNGYLAVAPDLFAARRKPLCMISIMRAMRASQGPVFEHIEAARSLLAAREDCTGVVGIIGYCMGGGLALLVAPRRTFAAASVNYGAAPKQAYSREALVGSCPIVGSYGGQDRGLQGAAQRLEQALTALDVPHDVKEYPGARHGFLNDHEGAGDKLPLLFAVMGKLTAGPGYDEASAEDARRRIVAFFDTHLREAPPAGSAAPDDHAG